MVHKEEAAKLLRNAFVRGMVSAYTLPSRRGGELPKYAWAVDDEDEVYEAKLGEDGSHYHGYRLSRDDKARKWILKEWRKRDS